MSDSHGSDGSSVLHPEALNSHYPAPASVNLPASTGEPRGQRRFHQHCPTAVEPLPVPDKPARKVSFSDYVITSSRVEKQPRFSESPERFCEKVNVIVDRRCDSPVNEAGHNIVVRLVERRDEEVIVDSPFVNVSLPVYEVKLGMLKQATIYHMEFTIPDRLPAGDLELLRYIVDAPGHVSAAVNVGANFELLSCKPAEAGTGHAVVFKASTTKQHRVNEFYTLRRVQNPTEAVHLILHGLSLGRGQGTPFLRLGIHRIAENSEYEDSDEFTEWPGFTEPVEEEEEEEEEERDVAVTATGTHQESTRDMANIHQEDDRLEEDEGFAS
ncbi:hypothetical protein PHET_05861 [Paragonimus heterotremus]|uniref:Adipose-secreted signaling protein n=1 Tax=Paragonimus heterotremus TaxID=100268 RepID=A0A8J4T000_9TREM|nr:hypothetical protein PHET_05861 [Paragonimus heterotremus]